MTQSERDFLTKAGLTESQIDAYPAWVAEQETRAALSAGKGALDAETLKMLAINGQDPEGFLAFIDAEKARASFAGGR